MGIQVGQKVPTGATGTGAVASPMEKRTPTVVTASQVQVVLDGLDGSRTPAKDSKVSPGVGILGAGAIDAAEQVEVGSYLKLAGVAWRPAGADSSAGTWVKLERPLVVSGERMDLIHVPTLHGVAESQGVLLLHGRLDAAKPDDGASPARVVLSGVSNLHTSQPTWDGSRFTAAGGNTAPYFTYAEPMVADVPAVLMVLDLVENTVHLGRFGGRQLPGSNRFHGFRAERPMAAPTPGELSSVEMLKGELRRVADGEPLQLLGEWPPHRWFFNPEGHRAYRVTLGKVDQVIRFQPGDYRTGQS